MPLSPVKRIRVTRPVPAAGTGYPGRASAAGAAGLGGYLNSRYRLGSVLAGGNSDPGKTHRATAAEWVALADAFHAASMDTSVRWLAPSASGRPIELAGRVRDRPGVTPGG